jgi:hypothetical protein
MNNGDIIKFKGRVEPCVVYRVTDATEILQGFTEPESGRERIMPHIKIEVMGYVPVQLITPVVGHPMNMFALDKMLHQNAQTN